LRAIALPREHGAWGFLFEPLVAAVAVAPSVGAVAICLVYIGAFLVRQPLRIFISDLKGQRKLPQTAHAFRFICFYGSFITFGLLGSMATGSIRHFSPMLLVLPLVVYQVYCDISHKSRELIPELTGSVAITSSAAVIALTAGWEASSAAALWGVLICRLIPSILYVRNRLRLEKGKHYSRSWVGISNLAAIVVVGGLAQYGLASGITVVVFVILLTRAMFGLSSYRQKRVKAMVIGLWEVFYGLLTVLSIILGYYLSI